MKELYKLILWISLQIIIVVSFVSYFDKKFIESVPTEETILYKETKLKIDYICVGGFERIAIRDTAYIDRYSGFVTNYDIDTKLPIACE